MKILKVLFALALMGLAVPVLTTGCKSTVTLEAGGAYTDANYAVLDQTILNASHAMTGFLTWYDANSAYLAKWPEVGVLAEKVRVSKDSWIKDAYAARDAYAAANEAYKKSMASAQDVTTQRDKLNALLATLAEVTNQISNYQSSHPHA